MMERCLAEAKGDKGTNLPTKLPLTRLFAFNKSSRCGLDDEDDDDDDE